MPGRREWSTRPRAGRDSRSCSLLAGSPSDAPLGHSDRSRSGSPRPGRPCSRTARFIARRPTASLSPASAAAVASWSERSRSSNVIAYRAACRYSWGSGKVRFEGEQCPAYRRVHVGVRDLGQPLRQIAADSRHVELAGRGAAKLTEQRMGQSGHELEPLRSTVTRFICSAVSRSRRCTKSQSMSTGSGSYCDSVSTTSATSGTTGSIVDSPYRRCCPTPRRALPTSTPRRPAVSRRPQSGP